MNKLGCLLLLVFCNAAVAEIQTLESSYISNYAHQVEPILLENYRKNMAEKSEQAQIDAAKRMAPKLAKCQFQSVAHYPKKYWEQSIYPITNGEDLKTTANKLETMIYQDIASGEFSEQALMQMLSSSQDNLQNCLIKDALNKD
ncbi:hypothetical protein ACMXYV_14995 [Neptuniibacter sp. SY11_33]|uniref:hypothetical protein n=1 Tax=Neptuniibacter sp. SY11_33 TaxID=3398215 RepID=UPI0039F49001